MLLYVHRSETAYLEQARGVGGGNSKWLDSTFQLGKIEGDIDHHQNNCVEAMGTSPVRSSWYTTQLLCRAVTRTMSVNEAKEV